MLRTFIVTLLIVMLGLAGCQSAPATLDPVSVRSTAMAMAWTSVAKTQAASTVLPTEVRLTRVPPPTQRPSADDIVLGR